MAIQRRPPSKEYMEGWERIFGNPFNKALERSLKPTPGSQTEKDELAGKYTHVIYKFKR